MTVPTDPSLTTVTMSTTFRVRSGFNAIMETMRTDGRIIITFVPAQVDDNAR